MESAASPIVRALNRAMANIAPNTPQIPLLPQNAAPALHDSANSESTAFSSQPIPSFTTAPTNMSRIRALQHVLTHAERIQIVT